MTVIELIERLEGFNPDSPVLMSSEGVNSDFDCAHVSTVEEAYLEDDGPCCPMLVVA